MLLKENVNSKIFITSYIGTYQNSLDRLDQDFILKKAKSNRSRFQSQIFDKETEDDDNISGHINLHKDLVYNYFEFICKIVVDFVSKRIKLDMINSFIKYIDKHYVKKCFKLISLKRKLIK